jgi:hypothetical protein
MDHVIQRFVDVARPEAQHLVTLSLQPSSSPFVVRPLRVFTVSGSIDFDDELGGRTVEINKVRTDRVLSPELPTIDLSHPEAVPQPPLGLIHIAA